MKLLLILTTSALLFTSCSKFTDEELWTRVESAKANSNWDSTLQVCQLLLDEYPESQYASWARFGIAESYRFKNQPREALNNYKLFYEKFPDMEPSALSLFLVGYIYNNNLQMFDSARVYYNLFLQKYPKHDLAAAVDFEVKTLGKSADEALMQLQEKPKKIVKK